MNVKTVDTTVIQMRNVQTLKEDLHVLVILDLLEMEKHVLVSLFCTKIINKMDDIEFEIITCNTIYLWVFIGMV